MSGQLSSHTKKNRLDAIRQNCIQRVDAGQTVDTQQILAAHPDLAEELKHFFATEPKLSKFVEQSNQDAQESLPSSDRLADTIIPSSAGKSTESVIVSGKIEIPEQFGRYRILKTLGEGAMGAVFLAEDQELKREIALKVPKFSDHDDKDVLERFYQEARSAATLQHRNICPVFDIGEFEGMRYISMAYIKGKPLVDYVKSSNRIEQRKIAHIVRKLAIALEEAHDQNVVHRDLKPANIMIDKKGEPVIMDFGLARQMETGDAARLTQTGQIIGSPAYMPPEQIEESANVGPASDIYSLGMILYEMLAGKLPFRGSVALVLGKIMTEQPMLPSSKRDGIDPALEAICMQMIEKHIVDRPASMKEVARKLTKWLKQDSATTGLVTQQDVIQESTNQIEETLIGKDVTPHDLSSTELMSVSSRQTKWFQLTSVRVTLGVLTLGLMLAGMMFYLKPADNNVETDTSDSPLVNGLSLPPTEIITTKSDYDNIATGKWVDVFKDHLPNTDNRGEKVKFKDGVLELNRTTVTFRKITGRNMIIRARVKYVTPDEFGFLSLRGTGGGSYSAGIKSKDALIIGWIDSKIHVLKKTPSHRAAIATDKEGFIDVVFAVIDDRLSYYMNGKKITEATDALIAKGSPGIGSVRGHGFCKDVQVMLLDDVTTGNAPPFANAPFSAISAKESQQVWAKHLGKQVIKTNSIGMKLTLIPPGEFMMGSGQSAKETSSLTNDNNVKAENFTREHPQHKVRLTKPFYLSTTEVTQQQWQLVMGTTPWLKDGKPRTSKVTISKTHPATYVSWNDAQEFIKKLNQKEGVIYRLPTEAEWEYACRAGTTTPYHFGSRSNGGKSNINGHRPYGIKAIGKNLQTTSRVGSYDANSFGLYDMCGSGVMTYAIRIIISSL